MEKLVMVIISIAASIGILVFLYQEMEDIDLAQARKIDKKKE